MLTFEQKAGSAGFCRVIGIDEAGRGPLAGPVVASAVLLRSIAFDARVDDSKKMTERQRETAFLEIFQKSYVGIGIMSEAVRMIVKIGQEHHGFLRIWAYTYENNPASQAVLRSVGFVHEGVHRKEWFKDGMFHDSHMFAIVT